MSPWKLVSFLFFFSSRRRHTRCGRDWSSDVCSSDLQTLLPHQTLHLPAQPTIRQNRTNRQRRHQLHHRHPQNGNQPTRQRQRLHLRSRPTPRHRNHRPPLVPFTGSGLPVDFSPLTNTRRIAPYNFIPIITQDFSPGTRARPQPWDPSKPSTLTPEQNPSPTNPWTSVHLQTQGA